MLKVIEIAIFNKSSQNSHKNFKVTEIATFFKKLAKNSVSNSRHFVNSIKKTVDFEKFFEFT